MEEGSPNWIVMGESAHAREAEAQAKIRNRLPNERCWAWINTVMRRPNGKSDEIDMIVLGEFGFYLIELKGWHGSITGGQGPWEQTTPHGQVRRFDPSPYNSVEGKAKRLKGALVDRLKERGHKGRRNHIQLPFVHQVVVFHGEGSRVDINPPDGAFALDGFKIKGNLPPFSDLLNVTPEDRLNPETLNALAALMSELGLTARQKVRMIGKFTVADRAPTAEGLNWQDFAVGVPGMDKIRRRLRHYPWPLKSSARERDKISQSAKREFALTSNLHHPNLCSAMEFVDDDSGPAVVFHADFDDVRLDTWMREHGASMTFEQRLRIIRSIADAVRYAHERGIYHRALTPASVYIRQNKNGTLEPIIRDWHTGAADPDAVTSMATVMQGTTMVLHALGPGDESLFLAPEVRSGHPADSAADIYGLGTLAYLILTGEPPAQDEADLEQRLKDGGLDPSIIAPTMPSDLSDLVLIATDPNVSARPSSAAEFLEFLTEAERGYAEEAVAEGAREENREVLDPLDATVDDLIDGRWMVAKELGAGSTGKAFLVAPGDDLERRVVIKVALDEDQARSRLLDEAELLQRLDHPQIVRLLEEPLIIGGRTCLVTELAGEPTLSQELFDNGRLTLERLHAWSDDLFAIASYLDSQGVFHRDLKPSNLGIRPMRSSTGADRAKRLTLFDFSLSREPAKNIKSGSRPYLDPFLGPAVGRPTYDSAAELYALAVILFEMATGHTPVWGDGMSAPEVNPEMTVEIRPDMFEGPAAVEMAEFFAVALHRNSKDRFDDLEAMARAWRRLFAEDVTYIEPDEISADVLEAAAQAADLSTPLDQAGLTTYAVSAARLLGAETVGDLLAVNGMRINTAEGVGRRVRNELSTRRKQWQHLAESITSETEVPLGRAVESLRDSLVPRGAKGNAGAVALARTLVKTPGWPSLADLASSANVSEDALPRAIEQLRQRWAQRPEIEGVAAEIKAFLRSADGVATVDEVSSVLVARHGSNLTVTADRLAAAIPVVRAVVEAQDSFEGEEILLNRVTGQGGSPLLLALVPDAPEPGANDGDPATTTAEKLSELRALGAIADDATAAGDGLVGAHDAAAAVAEFAGDHGMSRSRAVRLAALCSDGSAASTRGEWYRIGLPASVTVPRVLQGGGQSLLAEKTIRDRVLRRFPEAAQLPVRTELDRIVEEAVPGMHWDGSNYMRVSATPPASSTRFTAMFGPSGDAAEVDDVRRRLQSSLTAKSGLVLAVNPRLHNAAVNALVDQFDFTHVDLSARLVEAAKQYAATIQADWPFILRMDAHATGADRQRLNQLMAAAIDTFWPQLLTSPEPLLLTGAAVLARYDQQHRLAEFTNEAQPNPAARWLLVPHRSADAVPTLDGVAVPLGAAGWLGLPTGLVRPSGTAAAAG